jgi:hypothetical protein
LSFKISDPALYKADRNNIKGGKHDFFRSETYRINKSIPKKDTNVFFAAVQRPAIFKKHPRMQRVRKQHLFSLL